MVDAVLNFLIDLPSAAIYAVLGVGAAVENLFPPVPADTFILLGGFLAGRARLDPWAVFVVTWVCNVGSALLVYGVGRRYGRSFFELGMGRKLLDEGQLRRMDRFYRRWGGLAIFWSRFLPGFRSAVPVFAGVSRRPFVPVAVPLAAASAIWYGVLVWLGATTARNLETLLRWLRNTNRVLLVLAVVLTLLVAAWWWRSRRRGGKER